MGTRVLTAARPLGTVGPRATVPRAPGGPGAAGRQGRDEQRALRPCPPAAMLHGGHGASLPEEASRKNPLVRG